METFLHFPSSERRIVFEQTASQKGIPARSIEKDYWVCWTLHQLFQLEDTLDWFTFKGGTSLSKVYGLIERFSEDIDLVIDRKALGIEDGGTADPRTTDNPNRAEKRLRSIRQICQNAIREKIYPQLRQVLETSLPADAEYGLEFDTRDSDRQTLLFTYPSCLPRQNIGYISDGVRLEFGARSDVEPARIHQIESYCAQQFAVLCDWPTIRVRAIAAERTFWDKATLLHEECFRPLHKGHKARMARHYYDLAALIKAGVADTAMADLELFQSVVDHRRIFFPYYDLAAHPTMKKGSLNMLPSMDTMPQWEADYRTMTTEMIYGIPPTFSQIMESIKRFQDRFNEVEVS